MAITYLSNTANTYYLKAVVTPVEQDIANNQSKVNTKLYIVTSVQHWFDSTATGQLKVGGTTVWSISATNVSTTQNQEKLLKDDTRWITHNADGTGSGTIYATFQTVTQGRTWSVPLLTISTQTFTFTRIPRGPRVSYNGVWRNTVAYVRVDGVWKIAVPYVRSSGVWMIGGG